MSLGLNVLLIFIFLLLGSVFSGTELALVSLRGSQIEQMEQEDARGAKVAKIARDPNTFLSTVQIGVTLCGFLSASFGASSISPYLIPVVEGWGVPTGIAGGLVNIVLTLIISYCSIVISEMVPKRIAMKNPEKVSCGLSGILRFVSVLFAPLVWLLTASSNGILRLFGIKPEDQGEEVTEEEIMLMAEAGSEKGSIDEKENEFIQNIFDFKENDVGEVCTHRKDVDFLFERDDPSVWEETIKKSYHTFYPVCGKDIDDVTGVLNTKIYFRLDDKSPENVKKQAIVDPMFISETMQADDLFYRMKTTREYFAIVLDEYGGINGIITLHDLIELLVGDLNEKGEESKFEIKQVGENEWEINGLAPFDDVIEAMGIKLPEDEEEDYDYETFGGYVCEMLGEVPDDGTTAECEDEYVKVEVLRVAEHRIEKMRVFKKDRPKDEDEDEGKKPKKKRDEDDEDEGKKSTKADDKKPAKADDKKPAKAEKPKDEEK